MAGATVLLLGGEKLTVYATPGPRGELTRPSWVAGQGGPPPTVKTDERGAFAQRRDGSAADRIAVITTAGLLWVVSREQLPGGGVHAISLPEPAEVAIRCDIPEKPGRVGFQLFLRTFDGLSWGRDTIYLRDFEVPNPGELVIKGLPPARYVVERVNMTKLAEDRNLMTFCERSLVGVGPGKRAIVEFNRKEGIPGQGRVKGIAGVELRYGLVAIDYLGPEEEPAPRGGRVRYVTHFDVMPLDQDGLFVMPRMPARSYELTLDAVRASTPADRANSTDFLGGLRVVVPATGLVQPIEIEAKPRHPK